MAQGFLSPNGLHRQNQNRLRSNLVKTSFRGPTKLVLIIRSSSYQDIVIHVQYYSKPNWARKLVCVEQKFAEVLLYACIGHLCSCQPFGVTLFLSGQTHVQ